MLDLEGANGFAIRAEEIADANERCAPLRVLRGAECDIRKDGSLDLLDDVLDELDWVLSLHAGQRAPAAELTARVTEAVRHPTVRRRWRRAEHRPVALTARRARLGTSSDG